MLSIERCCEILNKGDKKYSKKEVIAIRDCLNQLAEIIHQTKSLKDETRITR